MKNVILLTLGLFSFFAFSFTTNAQNSYTEAIQMGDRALRNGQYRTAINKYDAAEAFDPSKRDFVRKKRGKVFDQIEALRAQAVRDKKQAKKAEKEALAALQKSQKLVKAIYFYDGKFAIARKSRGAYRLNLHYFIDENGDKVEKLGQWEDAEQFAISGFAKVKKLKDDKLQDYLLDTFGNTYLAAYHLKDMNAAIKALDLKEQRLKEISQTVLAHEQLQILLIKSNLMTTLPAEIKNLKNLFVLDVGFNNLKHLPAEIGQLKNLTSLNLNFTALKYLPEQIGQLKNLSSLHIRNAQLKYLPVEIGQLTNLSVLNLRGNQLTSLPTEIGQLKKLTYLNINNNPISLEEITKIQKLLPECEIIFSIDYASLSRRYFMEGNYIKAYETQKKASEENEEDSNIWHNLSWRALFVNKPKEAITAAQKTLTLNPHISRVETNLALGYLLNNQWDEAEKIYLKWKGKFFNDRSKLCDIIFLDDIKTLERAGIKHENFAKVKNLFGGQ